MKYREIITDNLSKAG